MLKALKEQNNIITGRAGGIPSGPSGRAQIIREINKITTDYEINRNGNVWEFMVHGGDAFREILDYLDDEGINYDITQDNSRSSTKIFEIEF